MKRPFLATLVAAGVVLMGASAVFAQSVNLSQGVPATVSVDPTTVTITPQSNYWNAVAVSPLVTEDWDIEMDGAYSGLGTGVADLVVANGNLGAMGGTGAAHRWSGTSSATVEHAASPAQVTPGGAMVTSSFAGGHIIRTWEVLISTTGTYNITVSGSASTSFRWLLYEPGASSAWRTRNTAVLGPSALSSLPVAVNFNQTGYWLVVVALDNGPGLSDTIGVQVGGVSQVDLYDYGETFRSFTPTNLTAGNPISVSTDIYNGGTAASGSFSVDFYASQDASITTGDYFLGRVNLPSLPAGYVVDADLSGTVPPTVPSGSYYVGWIIDSLGVVPETNEANNTAYKQGYVLVVSAYPGGGGYADLVDDGESWRSFSPTALYAGDWISVSTDVRNIGTAPSGVFYVDFYASTNTTITTSDYYLGRVSVYSIPAGTYANVDLNYGVVPHYIPSGYYWVGWIIDSGNAVVESNESNNVAYKQSYQLRVYYSGPVVRHFVGCAAGGPTAGEATAWLPFALAIALLGLVAVRRRGRWLAKETPAASPPR